MRVFIRRTPIAFFLLAACGSKSVPIEDATYVSTRTSDEVCSFWTAARAETATTVWTRGTEDACDVGSSSPEALDDAVRRLNGYRTLLELPSVVAVAWRDEVAQQCATLLEANDTVDAIAGDGWDCLDALPLAPDALRRHHRLRNVMSPAAAIDAWIASETSAERRTLGNRRWLFGFTLAEIGVGFAGDTACVGALDTSGSSARDWSAYPAPGPAPLETTIDVWSFHTTRSVRGARVLLHRVADGTSIGARVDPLFDGYGPNTVSFQPSWRDGEPAAGATYRVRVELRDLDPIAYDVTPVDCP